ncbi:MAG: hypothetical protein ABI376_02645 [Caulobacteraceae bacterium]
MTSVADPRIRLIGQRSWPGLDVYVTTAGSGRFEHSPGREHRLMVHMGAPAKVTCRHGRISESHIQRRGDIHLIPAGADATFDDLDPTAMVGVWMGPELMGRAGRGMYGRERRGLAAPVLQRRDRRALDLVLILESEVRASDLPAVARRKFPVEADASTAISDAPSRPRQDFSV